MNTVAYKNLNQRCTNPNNPMYKRYGAKGVKLLLTYEQFAEIYDQTDHCESCGVKFGDNNRKKDGKTVARIDRGGHYEDGNVKIVCRVCSNGKPSKRSKTNAKTHAQVVKFPKLYQKSDGGYYFTFKSRQYYAGSTLDRAHAKLLAPTKKRAMLPMKAV